MAKSFISAMGGGFQQAGQLLGNIGKFSISPIALSVRLIAEPVSHGGYFNLSGIPRFIGILSLPWTVVANVLTLPAGLAAGAVVVVGSPFYAAYKGVETSYEAHVATKKSSAAALPPVATVEGLQASEMTTVQYRKLEIVSQALSEQELPVAMSGKEAGEIVRKFVVGA